MANRKRLYIVVEGLIGVGKTTLVSRLADRLAAQAVYEEFEDNPFLPSFYRDREAYALSTQMFFLMSRYRQQENLRQADLFRQCFVSDYLFDKDRVFALQTLSNAELVLYEQLFAVLHPRVMKPDLVVYLRADLPVILQRIAARGRDYEADMDPEYLRALDGGYRDFFRGYRDAPILTVDTTYLDLRTETGALEEILEAATSGSIPSRLAAEIRAEPAARLFG